MQHTNSWVLYYFKVYQKTNEAISRIEIGEGVRVFKKIDVFPPKKGKFPP